MKTFRFWLKIIGLSAIVVAAVGYLIFIGIMNFWTAGPNYSIGAFYWFCFALHLIIILICVLFLIEKIKLWNKSKYG